MIKKTIKPWGYEQILEKNKFYLVKLLYMKKNHRCSLQYHKIKRETVIVLNGKLQVEIHKKEGKNKFKKKKKILVRNQDITLKPGVIHRMKGLTNCLYMEASTPQDKDVIRIQDDYKRT